MTGLEDLEASQRAISNLLYQHAHDSGRIAEPGAEFEIPMAAVRSAVSRRESGDRLRQSLLAMAGVRGWSASHRSERRREGRRDHSHRQAVRVLRR